MTTTQLKRLLTQTCTITAALESTSGEDGRPSKSWSSGATATTGIACRIIEMPLQQQAELASQAIQATHIGYVAYADAPASLKAATAERNHRISNILKGGSTVDAGPFDIRHVSNAAASDHHLELYLMRTG